jgi:adenylate cyclase
MQAWQRITLWLGSLPLRAVMWGLASLISLWAVADLGVLKLSSGLANSTYDAMVRARFHTPPVDPRIVIVDIDESSLQVMAKEFGRWPWPRDTLATVLDHIEKQNPASITWDILFSDPDRLSPGGDKAFDDAAKRSAHSHHSVTRLPAEFDRHSQITRSLLPGLWSDCVGKVGTSTVALIAPAFASLAAGRLGYNNGYPDSDGVLRRYRYAEQLSDGTAIQSMPTAVARSLRKSAEIAEFTGCSAGDYRIAGFQVKKRDPLIVWRGKPNGYPRVPFASVFNEAEGGKKNAGVPSFAGKIVLIGATASSLHDIHPTPLGASHAGVDTLATAIDNTVNDYQLIELPGWLQALIAVALVLGMAWWTQRNGVSSLDPALLLLPAALLGLSYLSLNTGGIFLDLHLAAGVALLYIALLKTYNGWRRNYWCRQETQSEACLMPIRSKEPVADVGLDRLIRLLEAHAPACSIMGGDASATWPAKLRWPQLLHESTIYGPQAQLEHLSKITELMEHYQCGSIEPSSAGNMEQLALEAKKTPWIPA